MSMIIDGTNGLTFNNATTQASAGKIIQVVQASYSTQVTTTSTSNVDTGLQATITPKFATSTILVLAMNNFGATNSAGVYTASYVDIVRGSTVITHTRFQIGNALASGTNAVDIGLISVQYVDSPATTSATTYKMQMSANDATTTATSFINGNTGTIILMEIAA
jgi:hypothetical protein